MPSQNRLLRYAVLWVATFIVTVLLTLLPALLGHLNRNRWGVVAAAGLASGVVALDAYTEEV